MRKVLCAIALAIPVVVVKQAPADSVSPRAKQRHDRAIVVDSHGDSMSLIDWSGGAQGDPRYDLALALRTEPEIELGETELAAFFEGYGGVPMDRATRRWFESLDEFF